MNSFTEQKHYIITIAGEEFSCSFEFPETALLFGSYAVGPFDGLGELFVTGRMWSSWVKRVGPRDARNEFNAIAYCISERMLLHDKCVMHAAAVSHNGQAYLIAAPSGVGKSTQVKTLVELYPNEFEVISGDRPVLVPCDNDVMVLPSPWNGKENWSGGAAAPLKAVVLLSRGEENRIVRLTPRQSAADLFSSLFQSSEDEEMIKRAVGIVEKILNSSHIYRMVNKGIPESSLLLYEEVLKEDRNEL